MIALALALAAVALFCGAVAGVLEATKLQDVGPWNSFLIYLGLLGVASTTWAESMDALPLTLVLGALTGFLPFMLAYRGLRHVMAKRRRW